MLKEKKLRDQQNQFKKKPAQIGTKRSDNTQK